MEKIRHVMVSIAAACFWIGISGCASTDEPPVMYGGYGGYAYNDGYGGTPPSIWTQLFGSGKRPPLTSQQAQQYAGMAISDNGGPYLQQLRQYAKNGDVEAQAWLGDYDLYEWRNTESASYLPSAFKWCTAAAKKGISMSEYDLALLYKFGWGTPANEAMYEKYIHLSADGGDAAAKVALAEGIAEINSGTVIQIAPARMAAPADVERASSIDAPNMPSPSQTANVGAPAAPGAATTPQTGSSAEACWHKAEILMKDSPPNYAGAYPWLRKAAKGGLAVAQYALGCLYLHGWGTEQDTRKAAYWCKKSAHAGFPPAQFLLAEEYKHGVGVAQNSRLAFHWFHKAAVQNLSQAQCALGIAYFSGQGVAQNYRKAFAWFHKA